jgi:hypothetical protein
MVIAKKRIGIERRPGQFDRLRFFWQAQLPKARESAQPRLAYSGPGVNRRSLANSSCNPLHCGEAFGNTGRAFVMAMGFVGFLRWRQAPQAKINARSKMQSRLVRLPKLAHFGSAGIHAVYRHRTWFLFCA